MFSLGCTPSAQCFPVCFRALQRNFRWLQHVSAGAHSVGVRDWIADMFGQFKLFSLLLEVVESDFTKSLAEIEAVEQAAAAAYDKTSKDVAVVATCAIQERSW
eukprot:6044872-Amphidinium_carterae.1